MQVHVLHDNDISDGIECNVIFIAYHFLNIFNVKVVGLDHCNEMELLEFMSTPDTEGSRFRVEPSLSIAESSPYSSLNLACIHSSS